MKKEMFSRTNCEVIIRSVHVLRSHARNKEQQPQGEVDPPSSDSRSPSANTPPTRLRVFYIPLAASPSRSFEGVGLIKMLLWRKKMDFSHLRLRSGGIILGLRRRSLCFQGVGEKM